MKMDLKQLNTNQTYRVIQAAMKGSDELVFVYEKEAGDETKRLTRFVRPIEVSNGPEEASVLCQQILPKSGFRRFKLNRIVSAYRVQTRESFSSLAQS